MILLQPCYSSPYLSAVLQEEGRGGGVPAEQSRGEHDVGHLTQPGGGAGKPSSILVVITHPLILSLVSNTEHNIPNSTPNSFGFRVRSQSLWSSNLDLIGVPPLLLSQVCDEIAANTLGKSLFVNWPHLEEARVVAVCDGETK